MFELLLQADRSLADGLLDQAERTYWQLIELDPTNAIAVAGLARVYLERGDEKSAHEFANQALAIDPYSIAAKRVLQTIAHAETGDDGPEPAALPLLAAERLEALSRRRGLSNASGGDSGTGQNGGRGSGSKARAAAIIAGPDDDSDDAPEPSQAATAPSAGEKAPRSRTGTERTGPLSEPMRERKASRLAAAGAAAAAAAHEPARPRNQPHHAMPVGRRFFGLDDAPRVPDTDDFAAAEMAAAVEAVDAVDEVDEVDEVAAPEPTAATGPGAGGHGPADQSDLLGAVDATEADESIALRIALLSGMAEFETPEQAAARVLDEESSDAFEAAEAIASSALHRREPSKPEPVALAGELRDDDFDQDAFDAAEVAAGAALYVSGVSHPGLSRPYTVPESAEFDAEETDADAAEAAAAAEAVQEVSEAEAAMELEPTRVRKPFEQIDADDPSEQEAESAALREALAIVLDGDGRGAEPEAAEPEAAEPEAAEPVVTAAEPTAVAEPVAATVEPEAAEPAAAEPAAKSDPEAAGRALLEAAHQTTRPGGAGTGPDAAPGSAPEATTTVTGKPEPPPRKGFFRRIRGK